MSREKFATVINCMDGRTQLQTNQWIREEFGVDHVDTVTEPGPDRILSDPNDPQIDSIKIRVLVSVKKHGSRNVVIVSHTDCWGNRVSKKEHLEQLKRSMEIVRGWGFGVNVIGIWIGEDWKVREIDRIESPRG